MVLRRGEFSQEAPVSLVHLVPSATFPLFSSEWVRRRVSSQHHLWGLVTPHTTEQAACLDATHLLSLYAWVWGAFTMETILAHLIRFPGGLWGFAHTVPCWKMRSGPLVCFLCFNCWFWPMAQSQGFFCRGLGFAVPGNQAAVSHPAQCETHVLLTPTLMPHGFQSRSGMRTGQSQMVWQTLFPLPSLVPLRPLMICLAIAFPVCGVHGAMSVFRNYLYHEMFVCYCW